ncbi:MAG: DUF4234 domain-containing protein [Clostridia bacterium]|nr:DUF4234 domain-containing protein [Clostridia bacterium]
MTSNIKKRNYVTYLLLSIITFGIYHIVFWNKISKEVNLLCEGDGKKTMKYVFAWLLSIPTLGIFGVIWKARLAERLKTNASRYDLKFSEGKGILAVLSTAGLLFLAGPSIGHYVLIKNYNAMGEAFNEYNGLADPDEDKKVHFFTDSEEDAVEE